MPNGFYGNSSNLIGLDSIYGGNFIPEVTAVTYFDEPKLPLPLTLVKPVVNDLEIYLSLIIYMN